MGLTIHGSLKSAEKNPRPIRECLEQLRQRALDLPFESVGELVEFTGSDADFNSSPREHPHRWLLIQAGQYVERDEHSFRVSPRHLIGFSVYPGPGCEQANFGLCRYPVYGTVQGEEAYVPGQGFIRPQKRIATGLTGWRWTSFCKTQYASNPNCGGTQNFLRCHLSVVALLDHAQSLGILDQVSDEGDYWENRDAKALVLEVGEWNEMISAFFGELKDSLGAQNVAASIGTFPNFEQLEA